MQLFRASRHDFIIFAVIRSSLQTKRPVRASLFVSRRASKVAAQHHDWFVKTSARGNSVYTPWQVLSISRLQVDTIQLRDSRDSVRVSDQDSPPCELQLCVNVVRVSESIVRRHHNCMIVGV